MNFNVKYLALPIALIVSGCATGPVIAPAGDFDASPFTLTLGQDWSSFPRKSEGVKGAVLTREGLNLNSLAVYLIEEGSDLKPGKGGTQEEVDYTPGLSQLELVEFATATLSSINLENLQPSNIEPVTFVGRDGVAFDFEGFYDTGLAASGMVRIAETDDGLAIGFYVAPTRVYFDRDKAQAETALNSVRL